ncbi:MAG: glutamate--tRNA ligase [Paracoccaceae bacterium]|nr:glutamate--tRNA ligase [Paracoccaceae bacterium]
MSQVVTRIAPSPTGYMHIGTARTALFNWLYARGRGGKFLLRIEDTDRQRSTPQASAAILRGLDWLGLDYDGKAISQYERAERHAQIAWHLLKTGHAFKCFATQEEIETFRETARAEGRSTLFQSPWRDIPASEHPDAPFVIRIKAPRDGETHIDDEVQGKVVIRNTQLDDMVLLRSDGSPVYMLAVVVDDHDMGITHVIRGDDHLNNAARQMLIYKAMEWPLPVYAHIPLIFGDDGKKLSKRHGATSVEEYQQMGYPAVAMRNYLARLGWSHGNDEFFSDAEAQEWFDFKGIGKSPSRFDFKKLQNLSSKHIAAASNAALLQDITNYQSAIAAPPFTDAQLQGLDTAMYCLKERAKTLPELLEKARFILQTRPISIDEPAQATLDSVFIGILQSLTPQLQNATWSREHLEVLFHEFVGSNEIKFGQLAAPLRAALAGRKATPSVYDMMVLLGRDETIARIKDAIAES